LSLFIRGESTLKREEGNENYFSKQNSLEKI
jgi:hypothetical protein